MNIGYIFDIKKGKKAQAVFASSKSGSLRYIQIKDLRGHEDIAYAIDPNGVIAEEDDLLIAWDGAKSGTVNSGIHGYVGSTLARLRVKPVFKNSVYVPYANRFLQSKFNLLNTRTTGSTIPHVSKEVLTSIEIPLPPLEQQRHIAAVLDKADELRTKRRRGIERLEALLQSVFLEMFGDPVSNPKGWELSTLGEVGKLDRGKSKHRPRNAPELLNGPYPLIQTGDIANSGNYLYSYTQTYSELGLKQSRIWNAGVLCITIAANIAKTAITTFDACFPDSVVGFLPNKRIKTEYVQFWLSFLQKTLEEKAPESAQKNINLKILRELEIPVPPMELQEKFAQQVRQVEDLSSEAQNHIKLLDNLFHSLQQRAFRGELT